MREYVVDVKDYIKLQVEREKYVINAILTTLRRRKKYE
jgi:hypothetical protein